jgi:WD40 repeat protein
METVGAATADVFLSYSRRDGEFVRGLVADLEARGKSVWLDTEGIEDAAVFPDAIRSAIEGSDTFLFVITPESAASAYCEQEVEHALALNKRLVPLLREPVADDALPEAIRIRNWIPYTADVDRDAAADRLVDALDNDLEHAHAHTRWLVKALEWESHERDKSFLLRGSELTAAETWLAGADEQTEPIPTPLQREYLLAGRTASARRQRMLVGASLSAVVVAAVLAAFALVSRSQAVSARATAQSRALAAESGTQLSVDPERALLLAMAADRADKTPEAIYALRRAIDLSPIRSRLPHLTGAYPNVAYSPDGTQIAELNDVTLSAASVKATLQLVDAATMRVEHRFGLGVESHSLAYSPSGATIAVGTADGVLLFDTRTAKRVGKIAAMTNAFPGGLRFSPDGTLVVAAEHDPGTYLGHLQIYDLRTHTLRTIPLGPVGLQGDGKTHYPNTVAFSPDGRRLLVTGYPGIGIFHLKTGRLLTAVRNIEVDRASYSPDGKLILATEQSSPGGGSANFTADILDARTLAHRDTLYSSGYYVLTSAGFSPGGSRIAFTTGHTLGIYSLVTHSLVYTTNFGIALLQGSAFSPDGQHVAVVSADGNGAVYRASGPEQTVIDAGVGRLAAAQLEVPLAVTADRVVATFSPTTGADAGKEIVESWSYAGKATASPLVVSPNSCPNFGVDPLGKTAFVLTADCGQLGDKTWSPQPVQIWNLAERRVVKTLHATGGATTESYPEVNDAGSLIVEQVAFRQKYSQSALDLLDVATGRTTLLRESCFAPRHSSAVSDDGTRVVALSGCPYMLAWRITANGSTAYRIPVKLTDSSGPLRFSPDGTEIAIGNMNGLGQVGIVDATSGKLLVTLAGQTDRITGIGWSRDGRLFATASIDGTIRIWDPSNGRLLRTLDDSSPVIGDAFSPNGRTIATLDANGIIRLWDACTDCESPNALMALAKSRVTRQLTRVEKRTYLGSG